MLLKEPEKVLFEGLIHTITDQDFSEAGISKGSFIAKAKSLIPEDFDPDDNADLLPVFFNLAVVNEFNKNNDGVDTETAMDMVKRFANKPINIEHKKQKIVGHIISASFSDKEMDCLDNDIESFKDRTDPFFINVAGVIYRHVYPKLAAAIMDASDPESQNYKSISSSWEIGFKEFGIAKGSKLLSECELVSNEADFKEALPYIKSNKNLQSKYNGVNPSGVRINRLIQGETLPLGAALTYNPAASVEGVYTLGSFIEEMEEEEKESSAQIFNIKNSLIQENIVKIEKFKGNLNMNEQQFQEFLKAMEQSIASVTKGEAEQKSISTIFKDALAEQGSAWESKIKAESEAKDKATKDLAELQASFKNAQDELTKIKADLEVKASAEVFNNRMNFIEEKFELSEAELQFVVAEVKSLASEDEAFENYKKKVEVLFSHKSKASIASQQQELSKRIDEEVSKRLSEKGEKGSLESQASEKGEKELEIEAESQAQIPNNNADSSQEESLIQKLKKNFEVKIEN
jgi:hypothetical protein